MVNAGSSQMIRDISIIIPYKNSIDTLERLLDSIPNRPELEVIVVDDKSEMCLAAKNLQRLFSNVRFVENNKNVSNAGAVRNIGVNLARSPWLIFADADDYFLPGAFEHLIGRLNEFEELDVVHFGVTSLDTRTMVTSTRHEKYVKYLESSIRTGDDFDLRYKWSPPWGKLIRRRLVSSHKIVFDEIEAGNDVVFSLLVGIFAKKVGSVDMLLYCITSSETSLTALNSSSRSLSRLYAISRYNLIVADHGIKYFLRGSFSYFIKSNPWKVSRAKLKVYALYFSSLRSKILSSLK